MVLMIETCLPSFILPTTSSTYSSMLTCHDGGNEYFEENATGMNLLVLMKHLQESWQAKHCQIYINIPVAIYGIINSIVFSKNIAVYYLS